jgi:hypothetical protein
MTEVGTGVPILLISAYAARGGLHSILVGGLFLPTALSGSVFSLPV